MTQGFPNYGFPDRSFPDRGFPLNPTSVPIVFSALYARSAHARHLAGDINPRAGMVNQDAITLPDGAGAWQFGSGDVIEWPSTTGTTKEIQRGRFTVKRAKR